MNNADTMSYKEFLEQLGVDCENYRKIAPDSIQLGTVIQNKICYIKVTVINY